MKNISRFSVFFTLIIILLASCEEFPPFEGTYTGTLTITSQAYTYPTESSITIVIERDFKDLSSAYTSVLGTFTLSGRIDNEGNFSVSQTGVGTTTYVITDVGVIDLATGIYTSSITIVEEGVTTITGTLLLNK